METRYYALIEWEDSYVSIIDVITILHPRKDVIKYQEGEAVKAKFRGAVYEAVICEISEDRKYLEDMKKKGLLKHRFCASQDREEVPAPISHQNVRITPKKGTGQSPCSSTPKKVPAPISHQNVRITPKKGKGPSPCSSTPKGPSSGTVTPQGKGSSHRPPTSKETSNGTVTPQGKGSSHRPPTSKETSSGTVTPQGKGSSHHPPTSKETSSGTVTPQGKGSSHRPPTSKETSSGTVTPQGKGSSHRPPTSKETSSGTVTPQGKGSSHHPPTSKDTSSGTAIPQGTPRAPSYSFSTPEEPFCSAAAPQGTPSSLSNSPSTQTGPALASTDATLDSLFTSDENNDSDAFTLRRGMEKSIKKSREKRKLERLESEVENLKKDIKRLKKRVNELEKNAPNETDSDQLSGSDVRKNQLKSDIKGMFDAPKAVNFLLKQLFTLDEIRSSSISGKKTFKCGEGGPRLPLDQDKIRLMEEIIYEKFPSFNRKDLREKIQNIQKVERKKKNTA